MGTIELRAFGKLQKVMQKKGYGFPEPFEIHDKLTGHQLLAELGIKEEEVEAIFINGIVESLDHNINPDDRVAILPPGTPGPYRVMLGIVGKKDR